MSAHLPRHRIEELAVRSSRREEPSERAHLEACALCAERLGGIAAASASFLAVRDPAAFARLMNERANARDRTATSWWRLGAYALAAAAAVLLWARTPWPGSDAIGFKGRPSFDVYVQRAGQPVTLRDGEALAPGDRLAFVYSAAEARNLWVFSIDEAGAIARYFPADAHSDGRIRPAARAQLPVGVELDDHRGQERIFALFSREPLDEEQAKRALRSAFDAARSRGLGIPEMTSVPLAVEQASIWFRKP